MSTLTAGLRSRPSTLVHKQPNPKNVSPESSPSIVSSASLSSSETELEQEEKSFDDPYPDFLWMTTEEPHRSRRMAILKAHPEVRLDT
jgi:sphingolipid delta-4 desaturase